MGRDKHNRKRKRKHKHNKEKQEQENSWLRSKLTSRILNDNYDHDHRSSSPYTNTGSGYCQNSTPTPYPTSTGHEKRVSLRDIENGDYSKAKSTSLLQSGSGKKVVFSSPLPTRSFGDERVSPVLIAKEALKQEQDQGGMVLEGSGEMGLCTEEIDEMFRNVNSRGRKETGTTGANRKDVEKKAEGNVENENVWERLTTSSQHGCHGHGLSLGLDVNTDSPHGLPEPDIPVSENEQRQGDEEDEPSSDSESGSGSEAASDAHSSSSSSAASNSSSSKDESEDEEEQQSEQEEQPTTTSSTARDSVQPTPNPLKRKHSSLSLLSPSNPPQNSTQTATTTKPKTTPKSSVATRNPPPPELETQFKYSNSIIGGGNTLHLYRYPKPVLDTISQLEKLIPKNVAEHVSSKSELQSTLQILRNKADTEGDSNEDTDTKRVLVALEGAKHVITQLGKVTLAKSLVREEQGEEGMRVELMRIAREREVEVERLKLILGGLRGEVDGWRNGRIKRRN